MKLLEINSCCGCLSTGRIAVDISKEFCENSTENRAVIAYARDFKECDVETYRIGNKFDVYFHKLYSMIWDGDGFASSRATRNFLCWADEYNPDVLWLHNIHGYYINIEMLFKWIKKRPEMQVYWTLHDCWAFTGHCAYFSKSGCNKWKTGCFDCCQKKEYPSCLLFDRSKQNYIKKRDLFTGVSNLVLITPSQWLANLVNESFLGQYEVIVKPNTIDENIFKPTPSNFVKENNLYGKKIVLGVANPWSERKGLYDFVKLAKLLDDSYKIVLVGINNRQKKRLPKEIITIDRTNNKEELAKIYSAATVFVNPTYEDNYPTTNLEAKSCGTQVVTYDTGGSPESVNSENVVEPGNIIGLVNRIKEICS